MVAFLIVERALVTFTATVTVSLDLGDNGLMIGVPIFGGVEGGACANASDPIATTNVKRTMGKFFLNFKSCLQCREIGALILTLLPATTRICNPRTIEDHPAELAKG